MSEEITQDLTQFQLDAEVDALQDPRANADDAECIAALEFEGVIEGEKRGKFYGVYLLNFGS